MKIKYFAIFLVLSGLLLYLYNVNGSKSVDSKDSHLSYQWNRDEVLYEFSYKTTFLYPKTAPVHINLEGLIHIEKERFLDEAIYARVKIYPKDSLLDGVDSNEISRALREPFSVKINKYGIFEKFIFSKNRDEKEKSMAEGFLKSFEFQLSDAKVSHQKDEKGEYLVHYSYDAGKKEIQKLKNEYTKTFDSKSSPSKLIKIEVINYRGLARVDGVGFWVEDIKIDEVLKYSLFNQTFTVKQNIILKKIYLPQDEIKKIITEKATKYTNQKIEKTPLPKLPTISLDVFVNTLNELPKKFTIKQSDMMKELLISNPEIVNKIPQLILSKKISDDKIAFIIALLGMVGTEETQKILNEMFVDGSFNPDMKFQMAVAFSSIKHPSGETIELLLDYDGLLQKGMDKTLAGSALMSVGSISSHIKNYDIEKSNQIKEKLLLGLQYASTLEETVYTLDALGNVADPSLSREIIPFLNSNEELIRKASVDALSYDENIEDILLDHYKSEPDSRVRLSVVKKLNNNLVQKSTIENLLNSVGSEKDNKVRYYIYKLVNNNKDYPYNESVVENLIEQENSTRNLKELILMKNLYHQKR